MNIAHELLPSDVQDLDEAETLLLKARAGSRFLLTLTEDEITSLTQHLSIVKFDTDEMVLKQGQVATWVGLVLKGSLIANMDAEEPRIMSLGSIVGEMPFFTGGQRTADVQGKEPGYIAIVLMKNLLKLFSEFPCVGCKFVRALGSSTIYKLYAGGCADVQSPPALDWQWDTPDVDASFGKCGHLKDPRVPSSTEKHANNRTCTTFPQLLNYQPSSSRQPD